MVVAQVQEVQEAQVLRWLLSPVVTETMEVLAIVGLAEKEETVPMARQEEMGEVVAMDLWEQHQEEEEEVEIVEIPSATAAPAVLVAFAYPGNLFSILNPFITMKHFFLIALCALPVALWAQCEPSIKLNGNITNVDPNNKFGISFPYWMSAGQTLAVGPSVSTVSLIEFNVEDNNLQFNQVLNISSTTPVAVPEGKVWKLESVAKTYNASTYRSASFTTPGTYSWVVPACAEQICIEVWGAGGGGGGNTTTSSWTSGGGGGGGGFGSECFTVTPGSSYSVVVGTGGMGGAGGNPGSNGSAGDASTVTGLISAGGGNGGIRGGAGGTGGTGGTSSAASNVPGQQGFNGSGPNGSCTSTLVSGMGGSGANGAIGGTPVTPNNHGNTGTSPGGGGSGAGSPCSDPRTGGRGGDGRVVISW